MHVIYKHFFYALTLLLLPNQVLAYIGPGAGLGAIAVTVALVLGVALLLIGLVWYPLKRMMKKKRDNKSSANKDQRAP